MIRPWPAAALLAAGVAVTGCAGAPSVPAATPTATPPVDPVVSCTTKVVYWVGSQLRGEDDGGDYQHHGLASEENDAVDAIVADVRAGRTARDAVPAAAHAACAALATSPPKGF